MVMTEPAIHQSLPRPVGHLLEDMLDLPRFKKQRHDNF